MNNVYEAMYHDLRYRAILGKNNLVSIYTQNDKIEVSSEMDFDSVNDNRSSINYFVSAVISGILHGIYRLAKKENINIEELEIKSNVVLENPLSYLLVKGYDAAPRIAKIDVVVYIYSYEDEDVVLNLCSKVLEKNILYQSIKDSIETLVEFRVIL